MPFDCAVHREQSNASIAFGLLAAVTARGVVLLVERAQVAYASQLASGVLPFSSFDLKKLHVPELVCGRYLTIDRTDRRRCVDRCQSLMIGLPTFGPLALQV